MMEQVADGDGGVAMTTRQVLAAAGGELILPQGVTHNLKMTKVQSKVQYDKGKAGMAQNQMDKVLKDTPGVVLARDNAKLTSQRGTAEEKAELRDNYTGYQTMDPQQHPVVTQSKKAKAVLSDKDYKQEWEGEKDDVYYPAHISEEYEAQKAVKDATADASYKADYESTKAQNAFQVQKTEAYAKIQKNKEVADRQYKADYENTKAQNTPLAETNEMKQNKELAKIKDREYKSDAKATMGQVNVDAGSAGIAHVVEAQKIAGRGDYHEDF